MALTGVQIGRIHATIRAAYTRSELRRVVKIGMDVDFDAITPDSTFDDQVFHLVRWADTQGRALELVRCVCENNQKNTELQALWAEAQTWTTNAPPRVDPKGRPWLALLVVALAVAALLGGVALWRSIGDGDGAAAPPVAATVPPDTALPVAPATELATPTAFIPPPATASPAATPAVGESLPAGASSATSEITATIRLHPQDGAEYVYVPPGLYTIGLDPTHPMSYGNEAPVTAVPLDGFWIMRTEVTNAAYATCVKAQACIEPNSDTWADASAADYPVTNVTWYHASQYAAWVGGRLPTEAEWEAACRGPNDQIFPWGNDLLASAIGNFGDREDGTMPVGSYPDGASPFGVLDMAGNVWEWTSSHYTEYPYAADDGREAPGDDGQRVVRGGSFSNGFQDVRCSMRDYYDLFVEDGNGGFRVVMSSFD